MKRKKLLWLTLLFAVVLLLTSCAGFWPWTWGKKITGSGARDHTPVVLVPEASGTIVYQNSSASIDASNMNRGYIMVKYTGTNGKVKLQITHEGGDPCTYNLTPGADYEVFPLSDGNGSYTVNLFENISQNRYSQALGKSLTVSLEDEFLPFLFPNQYVNFSADSACVAKASEVVSTADDDLSAVSLVYDYVVGTISYDYGKAATLENSYLPVLDETLSTKKGICFDYASLMTAMLRTQRIPAKLVIGYAGEAYHAWISVYLREIGWVDNMIYFDGQSWSRMDPTFASAGGNSASVRSVIGDGKNYNALYYY